jgi:hypothetical protein
MGEEVAVKVFSREDRQQYRDKVKRNLDVFARMLRESRFDAEKRSIGLEIELNLTDECGDPALANAEVLERISDDAFVTELGQFNIEINIPPRLLDGEVFTELEAQIRGSLNAAEEKASTVGAHMMIVGILPTLGEQHLHSRSLSANPRYTLLNEQIFAARGEDLHLSIGGVERLTRMPTRSRPRPACTSMQLHQLVHPRTSRATGTRPRRSPARSSRSARTRRFLRQGALARDADRAVRAGRPTRARRS